MGLYKTTIVIWSLEPTPSDLTIAEIAENAISGNAYCSSQRELYVRDLAADPDWDYTDFFYGKES